MTAPRSVRCQSNRASSHSAHDPCARPGLARSRPAVVADGADASRALRIRRGVERTPLVALTVDGRALEAHEGETLAAALLAAGVWRLRSSPRAGAARGIFCLMGSCQECLVVVDGRRALACQAPVRAGMSVTTGGAA